jgi:hypothetical protein
VTPDEERARPWSTDCSACAHTLTEGWTGLEGAHCHSCHLSWTSRRAAHCPTCCAHFTSYSASDRHDGPNGCIPPSQVAGVKLAADGRSWRLARESPSEAVAA